MIKYSEVIQCGWCTALQQHYIATSPNTYPNPYSTQNPNPNSNQFPKKYPNLNLYPNLKCCRNIVRMPYTNQNIPRYLQMHIKLWPVSIKLVGSSFVSLHPKTILRIKFNLLEERFGKIHYTLQCLFFF